jgi:membrane-bound metal-dependent hydrolase YbcI (DUF457 family)
MDTVTHGLTGWLLAKAVPTEKWGREAKAAVVLGSVLPDLDEVSALFGSEFSVRFHRGISHSFAGIAVTSLLLALLVHRFGKWKNPAALWLLALSGLLSHVALDLLNSYGTQIFQPFADTRVSFDLLFVIDLAFTGIVAAGLWLSRGRPHPAPARVAFGALALYVGLAAAMHGRAEASLAEAARRDGIRVARTWALPRLDTVRIPTEAFSFAPAAVAAVGPATGSGVSAALSVPFPAGPLAWNGFVDDGKRWIRAEVDPVGDEVVWRERVPHGQDAVGVAAVRGSRDVRTWLWFARFPAVDARRSGADNVLEFSDLRYAGMGSRYPFRLRVVSSPGKPPAAEWRAGD